MHLIAGWRYICRDRGVETCNKSCDNSSHHGTFVRDTDLEHSSDNARMDADKNCSSNFETRVTAASIVRTDEAKALAVLLTAMETKGTRKYVEQLITSILDKSFDSSALMRTIRNDGNCSAISHYRLEGSLSTDGLECCSISDNSYCPFAHARWSRKI